MNNADSGKLARTALQMMAEHGVSPLPVNYMVWYEYAAGNDLALHDAVDRIIDSGMETDNEVSEDLYRRFIAPPDNDEIESVRNDMSRILDETAHDIEDVSVDAHKYSAELDLHSNSLSEDLDVDQVRTIIDTLIRETHDVAESSKNLATRLAAMTDELGMVRQHFERARKEAKTDPLTGLANRKALDEYLEASIEKAGNTGDLCLIMADIDKFKSYNDKHGHVVGDQIIRYVGSTLINVVKGKDMVARYGGEEFAIVLPETPYIGARSVAEEVRLAISSKPVKQRSSGTSLGIVTLSFGVTRYHRGEHVDEFIARADKALYEAKEKGRNRVCGYE